MSRYIPEHPKKGSAEAYAWAEKMRAAREKKKRLKHTIRQAGLATEREFFGPGGPLAPKAIQKHRLNPKESYSVVCTQNGCVFHREGLSRKKANLEASSHSNMYLHDVAIVKKNPGAKWHQGEEDVAYRYKKQAKDQLEKAFFAGVEAAHKTSGSAARKMGMNPKSFHNIEPSGFRRGEYVGYADGEWKIKRADKGSIYWRATHSSGANFIAKSLGEISKKLERYEVKKNPIAVFNPPKVAGTIYNNAVEIKAQKTGGPLKGHYKHVFGSNVRILGLTDGTVLLQHKNGKPLWITRKDYERTGRKH